jgi:hypothetical protein
MLAFSAIPMFDRMDHPSVPTTFPWRTVAGGGQGWPTGHREAAPSVLCAGHVRQPGGESPLCNLMEVKHE